MRPSTETHRRPLAASRPCAGSSMAMCCLLVMTSATAVVNGFVVPSLFHSSFLSRWSLARQQATNNIFARRPTAGRRTSCRAWVEDDKNNEAMRLPQDETFETSMELLKYRIARNKAIGPGIQPNQKPPTDVHIILFYPDSSHEGVHTIEFPKGSGHNVILGFEDLTECVEFSRLLEQEEENLFVEPAPRQIHLESLEKYCATTLGGDVQVQVVPKGTHLVPPSGTVEELNHNPQQMEQHSKQTSELERLFELDVVTSPEPFDTAGAWE